MAQLIWLVVDLARKEIQGLLISKPMLFLPCQWFPDLHYTSQ